MSTQFSSAPLYGVLHVADVAERAKVTPATVRYYARSKLLSPRRNPENGYRCFSLADVHRVEFIRQAQALGLTIGDIRGILETVDRGATPCDEVRSLVKRRLERVQTQIADLQATEARMTEAVNLWRTMGEPVRHDGEFCPLIERVEVETCGGSDTAPRQTRRNPHPTPCHCPRSNEATRVALSG